MLAINVAPSLSGISYHPRKVASSGLNGTGATTFCPFVNLIDSVATLPLVGSNVTVYSIGLNLATNSFCILLRRKPLT